MAPSRARTHRKKFGKEKVLDREEKTNALGDSKGPLGRPREEKSKGRLRVQEVLPEQDEPLAQDILKSLVRPKRGQESGHKKLLREERASKSSDQRESGFRRKHGEQLGSKVKEKGRASKQRGLTSGQEGDGSAGKEGKANVESKKENSRRRCRKQPVGEGVPESVKSFAMQSVEGSSGSCALPQEARPGEGHSESRGSKEASAGRSGSHFRGGGALGKGARSRGKETGKSTRIHVSESAEEKILETSDNSCSESSDEACWTNKRGKGKTGAASTGSSEGKRSSLEEDGPGEEEARLEVLPGAEGKGCEKLFHESNEAASETQGEQVSMDRREECEDEGLAGLEVEEKLKKQHGTLTQRKPILAESREEDDAASVLGSQLKNSNNRENDNNGEVEEETLEKDDGQEILKDEHDHSTSSGRSSTEVSLGKGKGVRSKRLPRAVKAKLIDLSKVLQGSEEEEKVDAEGSTLEGRLCEQQVVLKEQPRSPDTPEQRRVEGQTWTDRSSLGCSKQELAVMMVTGKCLSSSHVLSNMKSKNKDAEMKSLTRCKTNPGQMALESRPHPKQDEGICSKPTVLETVNIYKEPEIAQSFAKKRSKLPSISNCSSVRKKASDNQIPCKGKKVRKVVGKLKLGLGLNLEAGKEEAEEEVIADAPSEEDNVQDGKGSKHSHTHPTFKRVPSWLSQKPAKKRGLKARLMSVARAIGISGWLLKKFGKRKKSSKPSGFTRMAVGIASSSGLVGRPGKTCPGEAGQLGMDELDVQESSWSAVEGKGGSETAEELGHPDLPSKGSPFHGTSSFPYLLSLDDDEEEKDVADAKFAAVFPRVHSIVQTQSSLSGCSGSGCSLEKVRTRSGKKSVTPPQQDCGFKCDISRSLMDKSSQRDSQQYSCSGEILASRAGSARRLKSTATRYRVTRLGSSSPQHPKTPEGASTSRFFAAGQDLRSHHNDTELSLSLQASGNYCYALGFLPQQEDDSKYVTDYSGEVDIKENLGVLQTAQSEATSCVHWSQQRARGCDPAAWLASELLLPRVTIENLSKWTTYRDPRLSNSHGMKDFKEQWEAEDATEDTVHMDRMQKQMWKSEENSVEIEETEDLTNLEEVCERSVLLCLKKRFHRNVIYTYIGPILVSVNPFKDLDIYSEDVAAQYQQGSPSKNAPHIFALVETAYTLSQSSAQEQCVIISGHSGSGKTEAAKAIVRYLTMLYQRSDSSRDQTQPCNVLPILESFGNARTILNDNSSRFGKLLHVHLQQGAMVGMSISQYLLEKSRVVFQAHGERNYHVFYELLAGLPMEQKEELYLQEAESYFYLNQGRACDILGKEDSQDFVVLVQALEAIGLSEEQMTSTWAVLAAILQLGNICFTSYEKGSFEHAVIASDAEIRIVANLLGVSADLLQSAVTHRVTVMSYERIFTPLSVEGAIDARDSIAKTLYYLLFEWLLLRINEWLAPSETDCTMGIVDIYGFEDLEVNSLEQLCINFANEHLQHFFSQTVIAQEEEEYSQERLVWIPISKTYSESCLSFISAKPHGILRILDDQTSLPQATDHTFLQKCHYHHGDSPWYTKPKLPLPVFTVKHYGGPVTYQVHKFLAKNRDQLRPEVLDIFSQSRLKLVSHIFQKAKAAYSQQRELGARGKGLKPQASTLVSKFQQSLQDLTAKLRRSHVFFIRCISPNPQKLPNIFDMEYVASQLRHSGILEAIHIRKEGYPVRFPFRNFLARYGLLVARRCDCWEEREGCAAVLSRVMGNSSELYQIGVTKVFLKEKAWQLLEKRRSQRQTWAIVTLQRNLCRLLHRRRLRVLQEKVTIIQAYFRGYQARKQYRRWKKTLMQLKIMVLTSKPVVQRRKCWQQGFEEGKQRRRSLPSGDTEDSPSPGMDVGLLEIPAELAALLRLAEGQYQAQANQITETLPPEVKVKDDLSLPPAINSYPFSTFIKSHFQNTDFPAPGQPLHHPLTRLEVDDRESALEINKLILRFIGDKNLHGWQEVLLGNYIAGRGLNNMSLRDEILSQVVSQAWKNPDMEQGQRAWVLMTTLLSSFAPSPALEKPLLKFVSDHGMEGYNAVCQRKILTVKPHTEVDPGACRAHPPTQLEWTANRRRGKMVLDVHTFSEEKFSAEVESWMTGEQYAAWLLNARGCDKSPRGWSVSMFTGNTWYNLLGCDFVLDLIGEMEEARSPSNPSQSSVTYPITLEQDFQNSALDLIPPAPGIQAPTFPPPSLPPDFNHLYSDERFRDDLRTPVGLDHYVDDLFSPVLHQGSRVPDMESGESLTGRMKGGGKIGPPQRGLFPSTGLPAMMQVPTYQPVPAMAGMMPASMPMMPGVGGMAPMPAMVMPQAQPMVPAVDPSQLAAQQQAFINQQAMLMAQQMTLQAMSLSQQQQQQQQQQQWRRQRSPENSRQRGSSPPRAPATYPKPKTTPSTQNVAQPPKSPEPPARVEETTSAYMGDQSSDSEDDDNPRETFQQKKEYFQKMGQQHIRVKKVRPPSKTWTPPADPQPEEEEKEEKQEERKEKEKEKEKPKPKPEAAPVPAPKPKKQMPPARKEPPIVKPSGPESRPAPSREIGNIIKMYQSRPAPEPQPFEPLRRVSKPFVKKNDPKNEALAKLGMMNLQSPKSSPPGQLEKSPTVTPVPTPPKKGSASSSIREKQMPLLSLFGDPASTPPASETPPAPPPLPAPLRPGVQGQQEPTRKASAVTVAEDDGIKTQLYRLTASVSFSYVKPPWKLYLRKEVFYPKENFSHPYCLNLLCEQIIRDTFSDSCLRISREEKRKMKDLLMEFRVGADVQAIQEEGIKKRIVLAARDNWANYFSRLFPVHGENGSDVQILGVSHRGLRLLKVIGAAGYTPEHLKILCSYSFADVLSVELKGSNTLEFSLTTEQLFLHSAKARHIKAMVDLFIQELRQDTNYVVALRSYVTDDRSLLTFKKGDLIRLLPMQGVEPGWQFGCVGGRSGLFPTSLVQLAAAPDYLDTSMDRHGKMRKSWKAPLEGRNTSKESSVPSMSSEPSSILPVPVGDRYTMVDFAAAHFQEAQSLLGGKGTSGEKKSAADLVQHTKVPIQGSLLQCSDSDLNELAAKNFLTVMRFMGDYPKLKNQSEVECVYEILQLCKEKELLHDEVYCQVIKQVTHNPKQESLMRGWLLLNLLTGYFRPSNTLMPYATKFLQQASSDPSSTHHELAKICQSNLRKSIMYGGRRHLPFPVEMEALLRGRGARRLVIVMPGGVEYLTRIKTFTVGKELLQEICEQMGAGEQEEIREFAFFAIRSVADNPVKMVRPMRSEEYLHDYLLEDNMITMSLRRVTWKTPLHFENSIYTDFHYGQILWDYLNGRILLGYSKEVELQVGILAMLQHWAKSREQQSAAPSREELQEFTPKQLRARISPQALENHVGQLLRARQPLQPVDAKIQFIEHVMKVPLFGYNIYLVERISDETIPLPCFFGVNSEQMVLLDSVAKICRVIPLKELQKMRTLRPTSEGGLPGIELDYGSAASPRMLWIELAQAKEAYHTIVVILSQTEFQH